MDDEFTRPLGLKPAGDPKPAQRDWQQPLIIASFLGTMFVAGAVGWLAFTRPDPAAHTAAVTSTQETQDVASAKTDQPAEGAQESVGRQAKLKPSVATDGEDEPAVLIEMEPTGSIARLPARSPKRQEAMLAHLPDPALSETIEGGVIPRRSDDGARPMDVYSRQPATEGNFGVARVVIIVGGMGISQTSSQDAIRKLPPEINLAFAPYGNSLSRWMQEARRAGHELLLQLPMEPIEGASASPGPHTLLTQADTQENIANLHWLMSRISNYVGVTNYLGARLMSDTEAMSPIFSELAERGLLFVDDGSFRGSRTQEMAQVSLLPYARADIVLDAVRTRKDIGDRLKDLATQAKRTGLAIGSASAFPESIEMIAAFARQAAKDGIEITPVSAVVADPEKKR